MMSRVTTRDRRKPTLASVTSFVRKEKATFCYLFYMLLKVMEVVFN